MSQDDIDKWNQKYQSSRALIDDTPDPELMEYQALLPKTGTALDLACGTGKNSLFLAQLGLQVLALDGSSVGLNRLRQVATNKGLIQQIQLLDADLEAYKIPEQRFDLIVVVRYLNRALFSDIRKALKPGGILFYKTFNPNILIERPSFNRDFTIQTSALLEAFSACNVLADNALDIASDYAFVILEKPL